MDASNEPLETISKVEISEVSSSNSESQEGVNQTTDTVNVQEQDHSETLNATTEIAVPDATAEITEVSATTTEPIVTKEPVIDNTEVTESTVLAETTQNDITTSDNQQEEHNINTNETTSNTTSSEIPEDLKPPLHGENIVIINNTDQEENTVGEATVQNFLNTESNVEEVQKLSDDEINVDDVSSDDESSSDESSSSDDDDDSSSDDDDDDDMKELGDLDDEEEESNDGPVKSTHEILNEKAPTLPEDYKIPENAPIEEIGEITGMVENTLIIKAKTSGEFRVLQEKSIFCFEDRTVIGPLFEIFGRVQQPVYSVKFNSEDEFNKFKGCKGKSVYYVVPDSQFLYTDSIKHIKGTDASNCHDEELPEEEQEYSDDEKESAAKQAKKKKKNSNKNKRAIESNPVPQTKRQNVAPYTPLSSTSNRTGLQNRGRSINPQNTNVYNTYQQQQQQHQPSAATATALPPAPPQSSFQQHQQTQSQYGQPYYPQSDQYGNTPNQYQNFPPQQQPYYQNQGNQGYNNPYQQSYPQQSYPQQSYPQQNYTQQNQYFQPPQQQPYNMQNTQVDPAQLAQLQNMLLQHLQNSQNQNYPPQPPH
ncbi:H/ACA ribonucleoprotein complex non-core subunit NAF1 [Candida tropicalis]